MTVELRNMISSDELTAKMEPFDSFWEGPHNVDKGYGSFYKFYKYNYLKHMPEDHNARILVISCGPGYFVNMLSKEGYGNVLGIDSYPEKVEHAKRHGLNCEVARAFEFLAQSSELFDAIFCEQELNHLTKQEMLVFLKLCREKLREGGRLVTHGLNGANPITGSEALAQNFDHYNTFTEYTFTQVLEHSGFQDIRILPLNLYVFWANPLNYALIALSSLYTLFFRVSFMMYGKSNKLFTKKIGAICRKGRD
jgi:2-polyprenyl-3-methyl-5-hydroxy-6-metoxy-1,4-benzoquinol methylase